MEKYSCKGNFPTNVLKFVFPFPYYNNFILKYFMFESLHSFIYLKDREKKGQRMREGSVICWFTLQILQTRLGHNKVLSTTPPGSPTWVTETQLFGSWSAVSQVQEPGSEAEGLDLGIMIWDTTPQPVA